MSKRIALTFDDGPTACVTSDLLDFLEEQKIQATFFVLGKNVDANRGIVNQLCRLG